MRDCDRAKKPAVFRIPLYGAVERSDCMERDNRPRGREKNVTQNSSGVHRRGEGLGTGPVGSGSQGGKGGSGERNGPRQGSGGSGAVKGVAGLGIPAIVIIFLLMQFLGGGSSSSPLLDLANFGSSGLSSSGSYGYQTSSGTTTNGWADTDYRMGQLNKEVAAGSREKYTTIRGNGKDQVTIMVYMCGTDLESRSGMASSDLQEMAAASYGDNVNVIVYTGGCKGWKINGISNQVNQIYQVKNGNLTQLVADDGSKVMTDPKTLSSFIKYCSKNFPANRNELIFWDHGGGSVTGFGYDEKNASAGAMDLAEINSALKSAGVKFDFIGFDACLMATAETALMLNDYADYMIASEETEPGIGWYYTNWLTKLGKDTSMPTLEIGKNIVDDFVSACNSRCRGQQTTLSVIDLAEFSNTIPENLNSFAKSVSGLISKKEYKTVSDARFGTREFAASTRIDQVDLAQLAMNMGTKEGTALADAIKEAVKYNKTSSNMTNAYGVSIYFPYKKASYVDTACKTYNNIGMGEDYSKCIRTFAKLGASGQIASGGSSSSPLTSLLGGGLSSGASGLGVNEIAGLLSSFSGGSINLNGLTGSNTGFFSDRSISLEDAAEYISENSLDASALTWDVDADGTATMTLPEEQWDLIHSLDLNMFYDDGNGYVDLGLDNIYSFDDDGALVASTDRTWLAIDGQPVAYYHLDTVDDGENYTITGRVPAMLNDERVNLFLVFDNENPYGYIAGAQAVYGDDTEVVAKNMIELNDGDQIDFLCDYYSYSGEYQDSYFLGERKTVDGEMKISNVDVGSGVVRLTYRFTDIYNQEYWSETLEY